MASNYLTLVNNVLRDMNEVELTSSNFATSRGVQTTVKDYVNRSISDILNAELNWPFTRSEGAIDVIAGKQLYSYASISSSLKYIDYDNIFLTPKDYITNGDFEVSGSASITGWTTVSGSPAASSKFGNTMRLTSAEATQAVADLIVGRTYTVLVQTSGATLTLEIGTSSGAAQTKSSTLTISSGNEVLLSELTFTATATTHYISFTEGAGSTAYVKLVQLMENVTPIPLKYLSYEEYNDLYRERDSRPDADKFADPEFVYTTYNDELGLTPIPDTSNRTLKFDYYITNTALSSYDDTSIIPTRFEPVVNSRAKYYTYMFRSDVQTAQFALKEYEDGIKRMRVELINRKNYMRAV
tara:strand:+ start:1438 stop:2502 length:1065 start_codon:yes stop_codon:yes gene_type:complete